MTTVLATMCCYNAVIGVLLLFFLVLLWCYDATCRLVFIVAVLFVLTDLGCVFTTMILLVVSSCVHHDCDITIVIQKLLRENLMALR
jgi:hypothetical protein